MGWKSEKIKIKGHTVTLMHNEQGRWATNYGTSDSRAGAIRQASAGIDTENDRSAQQSREQSAAIKSHKAKTVECPVCNVRVTNLAMHQKSARHRNAVAWSEHSRQSRY